MQNYRISTLSAIFITKIKYNVFFRCPEIVPKGTWITITSLGKIGRFWQGNQNWGFKRKIETTQKTTESTTNSKLPDFEPFAITFD